MNATRSDSLNQVIKDDDSTQPGPSGARGPARLTRGTALKALGAALIGGVIGNLALADVSAANRRTKKRRKKRSLKPRPKPRTTPAPPPLTWIQTFTNRATIRLNENRVADPYPASVLVSDLTNARLRDVNLLLHDLQHDRVSHLSVMLVSPKGTGAVLMHNVGGNQPVKAPTITLDDQAPGTMSPDERLTSGTYKPTVIGNASTLFPPPAPQGVTNSVLAVFNGENPNGEWKLFITDSTPQFGGVMDTGWSLALTYETPAPQQPKPKPTKPAKKRRRRNRRKIQR